MLRSCKYCGKIHDSKIDCGFRPKKYNKLPTKIDRFRWTHEWQYKRDYIKRRDMYCCQICIRKLYSTIQAYTYNNIQVHHAIAMEQNFNKRLDDDNLISLCTYHHELAEKGEIPLEVLQKIIKEQNNYSTPQDV